MIGSDGEDALRQLDDGRWDTPERRRWLEGLGHIYRESGVLDEQGFAPALQRCCPSAETCWKQARHREQPVTPADVGRGENGSILWPWIGDDYKPGGVCVVGMNVNHDAGGWWSIAVEYAIEKQVIDTFNEGGSNPFGSSPFAYRANASANAALQSMSGVRPEERPAAGDLAGVPAQVARVQSVKCSPIGDRSSPTGAMQKRCPSRFARHEIEFLRPGVVLTLGRDAENAVRTIGEVTWTEATKRFSRGHVTVGSLSATLLCLPHPSARGGAWATGQAELVASLRAGPLAGSDASPRSGGGIDRRGTP